MGDVVCFHPQYETPAHAAQPRVASALILLQCSAFSGSGALGPGTLPEHDNAKIATRLPNANMGLVMKCLLLPHVVGTTFLRSSTIVAASTIRNPGQMLRGVVVSVNVADKLM